MNITQRKQRRRLQARRRIRASVNGTSERPRLAIYKSGRYIYAQLIDDNAGRTLAQANSREQEIQSAIESGPASKAAAKAVGSKIAERATANKISQCVFDRGGYRYHGRVQELADAARENGLAF